jgi:phage/plasmid-like protein (TIGR03299 family)
MAHELTIRADGKVEMAFRKGSEFPWHFQETNPQQVAKNASTDTWIKAAGMEWTAERGALSFSADGETLPLDIKDVLYRSDNKFPLGIVSPEYKIVQPRECIEFFDDLVHTVGLQIDTAGTMFGGKRFWALAKIGEEAMVDKTDMHKAFLLITTSLDGSTATEARFTDVRVVCNNTLSIAMSGKAKNSVKVSHRSTFDQESVKAQLGVAPASFQEFMASMRKLADLRVNDGKAQELVKATLGKDGAEEGKEGKIFARTMDLFRGLATGAEIDGVEGTAYGLLNAYTETMDHKWTAASDSHRLNSALIGPAEKMKITFRDELLALVA